MTVVVEMQLLLQNSTSGQAIRKQIEGKVAQFKQEIAQQEGDLKKMQGDLEKQRTILSNDALTQRQRDLQNRYATYQQDVQNREKILADAQRDSENRWYKEVFNVIGEIAQEQKYQIVLRQEQVF